MGGASWRCVLIVTRGGCGRPRRRLERDRRLPLNVELDRLLMRSAAPLVLFPCRDCMTIAQTRPGPWVNLCSIGGKTFGQHGSGPSTAKICEDFITILWRCKILLAGSQTFMSKLERSTRT